MVVMRVHSKAGLVVAVCDESCYDATVRPPPRGQSQRCACGGRNYGRGLRVALGRNLDLTSTEVAWLLARQSCPGGYLELTLPPTPSSRSQAGLPAKN